MASTTALWFSVESAFSEIESLCVEARAAGLAQQRKQQEGALLKAMMGGRKLPEADEVDASAPRQVKAAELSRDLAFLEAHPDGADLVELRARLRKRFSWLKSKLGEALSEHEVYYALFPIVIYTDELVATVMPGQTARWESLQGELYDIDNGGELFYSILDERLRKEETPPVVFEIFYFCLSDGFLGMYAADRVKLGEYMARLKERIPLRETDRTALAHREPQPVMLVPFPWKAYVIGGAAVLAFWLLLRVIAAYSTDS